MSDPNKIKTNEEIEQVRAFLTSRQLVFADVRKGNDPPDVTVDRDGLPPLDVEVTKYHPKSEPDHDDKDKQAESKRSRVGMEKRAEQFREVLNGLVRQRPKLKGVAIATHFRDTETPSASDHKRIAGEMVRFIELVVDQGLVVENSRRF